MGPRIKRRLPKYVHGYLDRHGKPRHYLRRRGRKEVPLPPPSSPDFTAGVFAWGLAFALDSATGGQIVELLLSLRERRGMTILLVTNDDDVAELADRTLRIRDGRVQAANATPAAAPRSASA